VEWVPWLVQYVAGVVADLAIAAANFTAAAAAGVVIALVVAQLEKRSRRQEVRAAQKRGRLEGQFESIRAYAAGLHGFVKDAALWMEVWTELRVVEGLKPSGQEMQEGLEKPKETWSEVKKLEPRPEPRFVIRDLRVRLELSMLEIQAARCLEKWKECVKGEIIVSEEEANRFRDEADQHLKEMLERMGEAVDELEG